MGISGCSGSRATVTGHAKADSETAMMWVAASESFVAVVGGLPTRRWRGLEGSVRERHARKEGSVMGQR
jgi:hypothetical protein